MMTARLYNLSQSTLRFCKAAVLIGATSLLLACATTNKVTQDFKEGTNFQQYKTFSWHNFSSDIQGTDQLAIQNQIEQLLTQKGFKKIDSNADLVLDLNIIKQRNTGSGGGVGLSIGLPLGRHGGVGLGTSKLLDGSDKMAGLIILDITAQQTSQVIWRGSAGSVPMTYFFARNQAQLQSILRDLVNQFPPG
jgi:hypothetical protein